MKNVTDILWGIHRGRVLSYREAIVAEKEAKLPIMPSCKNCSADFQITKKDLEFFVRTSPRFGDITVEIPAPTLCPLCRWQRRMSFRNERNLYRRQCDLSGKQILSTIGPNSPYKVYDQPEWWSDKWEALTYGRAIDFQRTFTEQFRELTIAVPHISLFTTNCENSYYSNYALNLRNCYLIYGGTNSEDCLFGRFIIGCRDVVDSLSVYSSELCFETIASEKCYNCHFVMNSRNCTDCSFCEDCLTCNNCIFCFGLHKAEYCILNKQVSRSEFEKYRASLYPLTNTRVGQLWAEFETFKKKLPHRGTHVYGSEDCIGDMILNSARCEFCFDINACEDCKYVSFSPNGKASYDATYTAPAGVQYCYEVCSTLASRSMGTFLNWYCDSAFYSIECHSCRDIFGCVGLRNKQYCIFNKQYSEAEYNALAAKLAQHMTKTGEWGEYLNPTLSFFGYNETVASEYFEVTEEEAQRCGWKWVAQVGSGSFSNAPEISDTPIDQIGPEICEKVFSCCKTKQSYKVIPAEYKFLKQNGLPLPNICPDERHRARLRRRSPRWVWPVKCAKTGESTWSTYAPGGNEIIYSEEAYVKEFYS